MGILVTLAGMFRNAPGKDGLWDFLGKRSADKSRVELEKARSDATEKLIPLLKPGTTLIEGGPDWHREIRVPEEFAPGIVPGSVTSQPPLPLPPPLGELEAAPRPD